MKKNLFVRNFLEQKNKKRESERQVVEFSKKMQKALGIDGDMLQEMYRHQYSMGIGGIHDGLPRPTRGVKIKVENRAFTDGWVVVVEAHPTDEMAFMYSGWTGLGGGTSKIVLPSEKNQKEILKLIKAHNKE